MLSQWSKHWHLVTLWLPNSPSTYFDDTVIVSIVVPLVDSTLHLQLYQVHSGPVVSTMLFKIPNVHLQNPFLAITDGEQYYTHPVEKDIMKCLISKWHYCSLSWGLCPVQRSIDCGLVLYFGNNHAITDIVLLE